MSGETDNGLTFGASVNLDEGGAQDGQMLRYDYTIRAFGVAISLEDDNSSTAPNTGIGDQESDISNAAYGHNNDLSNAGFIFAGNHISIIGVSADATFGNGLFAGVQYLQLDADTAGGAPLWETDHVGVGIGYTNGALSLHANYGQFKSTLTGFGGANPKSSGIGLAAAYDLGGRAVVHAGYGKGKLSGTGFPSVSTSSMSLGLGLSFQARRRHVK